MKKVSIIIPIFNVKKYLKECINSVLNQTYRNMEILLIDDGSTDGTSEICDSYAENENVKVFHLKNGGVSKARNFGINKANGFYLMFIDSDDYIENNMVEKMVNSFENNDVEMVACGYDFVYKDKKIKPDFPNNVLFTSEEAKREIFLSNSIQGFSVNKLYISKIIKENNILFDENIKICEDMLFVFEYLSNIKNIYSFSDTLYHYRMRKSSASNFKNDYDLSVFDVITFIDLKDKNFINDIYDFYSYIYFKYYHLLRKTNKIKEVKKINFFEFIFNKNISCKTKILSFYYLLSPNFLRQFIKKEKQKKYKYFE